MQTDTGIERQLPARIVSAIRRHQDDSERLVGWIQLIVVFFFGLLYGVSPKTFMADQTFALVPWFLAGYAVLTSIRLWLAIRGRLNSPWLYLSVVAAGPVVFGAVGDASRLEYTVIGDAVNLSAKLEKHNKAEGVRALAPARDFELAIAQGYSPPHDCRHLGPRRVDGVDVPLDLVVLAP